VAGDRPVAGNRPGVGQHPGVADRLPGNRPDRIDNMQNRVNQRNERRDSIRDNFRDHHPHWDFWKDHPNWARWRWNRPYRWATWAAITSWFPWGWGQPAYYNYGDNIYYEGDNVYNSNQEVIATTDEYAQQAQDLAASAPDDLADDTEWMTLGVFALTPDGQSSDVDPVALLQLAVSKDGVIAGTVQNQSTNETSSIEGMVDKDTQRAAWVITGKTSPIMETGVNNLTEDDAPALLHFDDGQTQQWLMVRLEDPESGAESK
jgi:hypothetical protein